MVGLSERGQPLGSRVSTHACLRSAHVVRHDGLFVYAGGGACMRCGYSMGCLPSALPSNKGLRATVRRCIKNPWLGTSGSLAFTRTRSRFTPLSPHRETRLSVYLEVGYEPTTDRVEGDCSTLSDSIPAKMCASRWFRRLLRREMPHTFCLSPAGYSTVHRDAVLAPGTLQTEHGLSVQRSDSWPIPYPSPLASRCDGGRHHPYLHALRFPPGGGR